ncbi:hypothetical protein A9K97_gp203 [Tokyovirus A1]|uniref:hypothetical protein n=1 Tax=Tokyovirus A1 TaxID=1826170 RepID=UPI0007A98259|nr:hypothetical protein A9K97_gp203 [Tokyovirus A1]BAU80148.1 hypothetical protein [Tokyovirus A1]
MFTFGFVRTATHGGIFRDSYRVWTERKESLQKIVEGKEGDCSIPKMTAWFSAFYPDYSHCFEEFLQREDAIISRLSQVEGKEFEKLVAQGRTNAERMAEFLSQHNPWFLKGPGALMLQRFFDMFVMQKLGYQGCQDEQTRLSFQIAEEFAKGLVEQLGLV